MSINNSGSVKSGKTELKSNLIFNTDKIINKAINIKNDRMPTMTMSCDLRHEGRVTSPVSISSVSAKPDRRVSPRLIRKNDLSNASISLNEIQLDISQILNISREGISLRIPRSIPLADRVNFRISIQNQPEIHGAGRVIWVKTNESENHFGVHLYYFADSVSLEQYERFVQSLQTSAFVDDRRQAERRRAEYDSAVFGNKRRYERRIIKKILLKCNRYERTQKARNDGYYFYFQEIAERNATEITINGRTMINFGSNNYLGLGVHPEVKEAAIKAIERFGVGIGSSRLMSGHTELHFELEQKLASYFNAESCMVFLSGYHTNVGVISALAGSSDAIIFDELAHTSIIDGCRLSGAKIYFFKHNDCDDLRKKINLAGPAIAKMIVVDGVYSMDGDLAKLDEILDVAENNHAALMVDDAHGIGIVGQKGRGTLEHYGLMNSVDLLIGTMSKAFGAIGGFVITKKKIIEYLKHNSRSFIFSASLPPAICAAVLKSIELVEKHPEFREQLWQNIEYMKQKISETGISLTSSQSAILPLVIRDEVMTFRLVKTLFREGIFVNPVVYPAVKKHESRIRLSVMATHTREQIDRFAEVLGDSVREAGLIEKLNRTGR